jgi:hypothetical protein
MIWRQGAGGGGGDEMIEIGLKKIGFKICGICAEKNKKNKNNKKKDFLWK